jgi:hypothetical protein
MERDRHYVGLTAAECIIADDRNAVAEAETAMEAFVLRLATQYSGRPDPEHAFSRGGVRYWCVGVNSTHNFYLGVDPEGRLWRGSVGETGETDPHGVPVYASHITELDPEKPLGYLGHF